MKINLKQEANHERDNLWKWSVWVDGDKGDLAQIDSVEYTLHPTFSPPVRRITDRASKFRLDSSGWGEFWIRALVEMKDGHSKRISHWLKLEYPPAREEVRSRSGQDIARKDAPPRLFISSNIADMPLANALSKALIAEGLEILLADDQPSELPWEASLDSLLNRADFAVFIISDSPGSWMRREIEGSLERKIPIIPVVLTSSRTNLKELPVSFEKAIHIKPVRPEYSEKVARHLASRILEELKRIRHKARKGRETSDQR